MRLHRLEVTAFGPYPGHETVDFDALGADGVFLLHGDTGAGKTMLLDAVAYALFGAVPGVRDEARRLRCDYAEPDTMTSVALELTVQGHRLRITRSPEYERPKRRGDGTTRQPAKASLAWVGPVPSGHAPDGLTRIDEVARTIEHLLAMSKDQFFQVVLLPQGDFARFLRADTAEREKLLEKLFGTQHFARVESWFKERRTDRYRALQEHRQTALELLARLAQAAGDEPPDDEALRAEWVDEVVTGTAAHAREAVAVEIEAALVRDRADAVLLERKARAERIRLVRTARADLDDLVARADELAGARAAVDAAQRAGAVVAAERARTDAAARVQRAAAARVRCREELADLGYPPLTTLELDLPALARPEPADPRGDADLLREQAGALTGLVAEEARQREERAWLSRLERDMVHTKVDIVELTERRAAAAARVATLKSSVDESAVAEATLPGLRAAHDAAARLAAEAAALPVAEQNLHDTAGAHRDAVDAHQRARQALLDLRARRLDGMAAELAAALVDGSPCLVCGATEHPAPAEPGVLAVTAADEELAGQAEQRALAARDRAAAAVHSAEVAHADLVERVGGRAAEEIEVDLTAATADLAVAGELAGRHARLLTELAAAQRDEDLARERLGAAEQKLAATSPQVDTVAAAVQARGRRLTAARDGHPDVAARRAHLLRVVAALNALADAVTECDNADEALAERQDAVRVAVVEAGFTDVAEALAAGMDAKRLDRLRAELTEADTKEAAARRILADPELAGLDPAEDPALGPAADAAAQARAAVENAVSSARAARRREQDVAALAERLRAAWQDLAPREAEYTELAELTDLVNGRGQNARKLSLRSYVLAARLAEVAVAAGERLRRMSQGRYTFVHTESAGAHGTRGGLGIDVLDDYSGRVRPAKTLSGGEAFLASLALALGLADVVAAETGGALLDTLFVDEGFGSLDSDTLDEVMNALDELRAGGRVVGLVSHVEELRLRIPTRLRVRKARTGSTVEYAAQAG